MKKSWEKRVKVLFYLLLVISVAGIVTGYIIEDLNLIFGGIIFAGVALNGLYAKKFRERFLSRLQ